MGATIEIWLCTDKGDRLHLLDAAASRLEYVKRGNGAGYFRLVYGKELPAELLQVDRMVQVWRRPDGGGALSLEFLGFLRYWKHEIKGGEYSLTLAGMDQNELAARRIVAYAAGTANAMASGPADDEMKDVFDTNFVNATDADRNLDDNSQNVTVQGDQSLGASISKGFSWRDVPRVLGDLADAARTAGGVEIFYALNVLGFDAQTGIPHLQFQTQPGRMGRDLTNRVIFGTAYGNVEEAVLEEDWRDEVNFVYAAGQGEGPERVVKTAEDTARSGASIWNRREGFADARNEVDPDAVQDVADAAVAAGRPRLRFEATILDTADSRYGRDWLLGDAVTVHDFGREFWGVVRVVKVIWNRGAERVSTAIVDESV